MHAQGQRKPKSEEFRCRVGSSERRRILAEKQGAVGIWTAFGSMGAVGWFVALPAVLGCLLGVWIDHVWNSPINWTLTMLGAGLFFGCVLAGIWMNRERNRIIREREELCIRESDSKGDSDAAGE
ncbi:AtpZ/AtpI family protein [Maridesulfovibrio sp.]|uniref:AtpZ/AtpI family protein n=1 Tax=Maridesulfovibrio sp. TaxID=2795000 RepID=UPI002A1871FC|nr:AtpZ/AtpI family protein [Maridesulfovibrio sp.]